MSLKGPGSIKSLGKMGSSLRLKQHTKGVSKVVVTGRVARLEMESFEEKHTRGLEVLL